MQDHREASAAAYEYSQACKTTHAYHIKPPHILKIIWQFFDHQNYQKISGGLATPMRTSHGELGPPWYTTRVDTSVPIAHYPNYHTC